VISLFDVQDWLSPETC